jgi:hypothetical protein
MFASGAHDGFVKLHMLPDSYNKSPGYKPVFPQQKEGWKGDQEEGQQENNDNDDECGAEVEEGEEEYYYDEEYDEEYAEEGEAANVDDV